MGKGVQNNVNETMFFYIEDVTWPRENTKFSLRVLKHISRVSAANEWKVTENFSKLLIVY